MCDCYGHKCKLCDEVIPMHLGDFDTGRGEVDVYCWRHNVSEIDSKLDSAITFFMDIWPPSYLYRDDEEDGGYTWKRAKSQCEEFGGKFITVDSLTKNAWKNKNHNHPNLLIAFYSVETRLLKEFFAV